MIYQKRLLGLLAALSVGFVALAVRLFVLQVVHGAEYEDQANRRRLRIEWTETMRGTIVDRRGQVLARDRIAYDLDVVAGDLALAGTQEALVSNLEAAFRVAGSRTARGQIQKELDRIFLKIDGPVRPADPPPTAPERRRAAQRKRRLTLEPQAFLKGVDRAAALFIEANPERFPGIEVRPRYVREYPFGDLTAPIVGVVGPLTDRDIDGLSKREMFLPDLLARFGSSYVLTDPEYRRSAYEYSDRIGRTGLERVLEDRLRGMRGIVLAERRRRGSLEREFTTSVILSEEPEPGEAVHLTIDADLQRSAEEAMGARTGAAVVMEPETGEIQALVSAPRGRPGDLNRAIRGTVPPASTLKIVSAAAALEEGLLDPHAVVTCDGSYQTPGRVMHCPAAHGTVDLVGALQHSCNCYFYEVAGRLRAKSRKLEAAGGPGCRIGAWLARFGFSRLTGIELASEELPGDVPSGDDYNVVIGQGGMLATPLQVGRMMAAIANGGFLVRPHLVAGAPLERTGIGIHPATIAVVREGLRQAVVQGTAAGRGLAELGACGKTGTAQVVRGVRGHSWFVGYAPQEHPRFVVCVFVENDMAGGGAVAAPIAAQILRSALEGPRQ